MNLRTEPKQKKKLHFIIALDESGSMESIKNVTIDGLNENIQEHRKKSDDIDTTVTLVTFSGSDNVKLRYLLQPIQDVEMFNDQSYKPDGCTAMYDGVAKALLSVRSAVKDDDDLTSYLVLVVSDGYENASKEFDALKVSEIIKELQDTKRWSINYAGANQDLSIVKQTLGLGSVGNTLTYEASNLGATNMWNSVTNNTVRYRGTVSSCSTAQAVPKSFFTS